MTDELPFRIATAWWSLFVVLFGALTLRRKAFLYPASLVFGVLAVGFLPLVAAPFLEGRALHGVDLVNLAVLGALLLFVYRRRGSVRASNVTQEALYSSLYAALERSRIAFEDTGRDLVLENGAEIHITFQPAKASALVLVEGRGQISEPGRLTADLRRELGKWSVERAPLTGFVYLTLGVMMLGHALGLWAWV